MNGYILTPTTNTIGWVVYENDISLDYKEFFKGELLPNEELPLFYDIPKSSNLKKIKSAVLLESAGPELVSQRLKEVLETLTEDIQFFDVDLFCGKEKVEGFYAMNFDRNNPEYMFYYMKLRENIFNDDNADIVRCEEMHRSIVVNEKIKKALFEAVLKGLQFSNSIDISPKDRTIYERI